MSIVHAARHRAKAVAAFVTVTAVSSLAFAAPMAPEDIRDIRGPIPIPPWWRWPLAIAIAAVLAFAVILLVRWWRERASRPLSPLERARRALALAETHAREGRAHAWAELVAETVRSALAVRLGTEVLPLTTAELALESWTVAPLKDELDADSVLDLLETCDLARFAKASLEPAALLAFTGRAREVVERLFAPPPRAPTKAAPRAEMVTT
jgi:hypothetical protein